MRDPGRAPGRGAPFREVTGLPEVLSPVAPVFERGGPLARALLVVAKPDERVPEGLRELRRFGEGDTATVVALGDPERGDEVAHDPHPERPDDDAERPAPLLRFVQQPDRVKEQTLVVEVVVDPREHLVGMQPQLGDGVDSRRVGLRRQRRGQAMPELPTELAEQREAHPPFRLRERLAEVRKRAMQVPETLAVFADAKERFADLAFESPSLDRIPAVAKGASVRGDRLVVERDRLGVGRHPAGLVRRAEQVLLGLRPVFCAREVVCEHAVEVLEPIREQRLDRRGDEVVQLVTVADEDAVVRGLLDEDMAERILQLRQAGSLENDLETLERAELTVKLVIGLCDAPEDSIEERTTDHRRDPDDAFELVVESVDARTDDALDAIGDAHVLERPRERPPLGAVVGDDPELDQRADELLDEERVALRLREHDLAQPWRRGVRAEECGDET